MDDGPLHRKIQLDSAVTLLNESHDVRFLAPWEMLALLLVTTNEGVAQWQYVFSEPLALFFVTMGALVNPRVLVSKSFLLLSIVGLTVIGRFVIWVLVVRLFRYPWKTALTIGLGLTKSASSHTFSYRLLVMLA